MARPLLLEGKARFALVSARTAKERLMPVTINTNESALVALQNLNKTNRELDSVQKKISTGYRVADAVDDAGIFSVAQSMRADISAYDAVSQSVNRGINVVDVAIAASTSISDLLIEMKTTAVQASDPSLTNTQRTFYDQEYQALIDQLLTIVNSASFGGFNLINQTTTDLLVLSEPTAATSSAFVIQSSDYKTQLDRTADGGQLGDLTTAVNAQTEVAQLNLAIEYVNGQLAVLGGHAKQLESHAEFIVDIQDALTVGVGNLVDADLGKESAALQALQTRQQLATEALAIANRAPTSILALFR